MPPRHQGDDAWAPLAERFVEGHYGSLRGRVRTHVTDHHLRLHLGPPPQRVLDVGGGAGNQSIPLARAGHDVTILDPSPAMLERRDPYRRLSRLFHLVGRRPSERRPDP